MMKNLCCAALIGLAFSASPAALAADQPAKASSAPFQATDLVIYHVEGRRSQRVVWLCEELGLPYTLIFKRGDVGGSFKTIRDTFPDMAVAPNILFKGHRMVESGAILDFLSREYGQGKTMPKVGTTDYMYYLQWLHMSEGSALPILFAETRGGRYGAIGPARDEIKPRSSFRLGTPELMAFIEDYLSKHPYFGGQNFSAADIMMHLIASNAWDANYFDLDPNKYPRFAAWQKRVEARPGYIKAMDKALPDHQPGQCRIPTCSPAKAN